MEAFTFSESEKRKEPEGGYYVITPELLDKLQKARELAVKSDELPKVTPLDDGVSRCDLCYFAPGQITSVHLEYLHEGGSYGPGVPTVVLCQACAERVKQTTQDAMSELYDRFRHLHSLHKWPGDAIAIDNLTGDAICGPGEFPVPARTLTIYYWQNESGPWKAEETYP